MKCKKIGLFVLLFIVLSIQSLCLAEYKPRTVYKEIFIDVDQIMLYKLGSTSNKDSQVMITGNDLKRIKHGLKKTKYIREISAERAETGSFKEGYRVLFLVKGNKNMPILYSTTENAIIVNKADVVPYDETDETKITVLQFRVKKSVMKIIKRYEQKLPADGSFVDSWPPYIEIG